jgi:hypothetical protein
MFQLVKIKNTKKMNCCPERQKTARLLTEEILEAFLLLVDAFQWSFVTCGVYIKFRVWYNTLA